MRNQKLSKNVCLENIRSVVQTIIMPQTSLTVLICMIYLVVLKFWGTDSVSSPPYLSCNSNWTH